MTTLENTLDQILVFMRNSQATTNSQQDNASEAATQEGTTVTPPALQDRGAGE